MEGRDRQSVYSFHTDQFQNPKDRSATKRTLQYWIDLAKLLDRGGINALFLADTYGGYDTYEGSLDNCIRRAAQWPMTDPTIVRSVVLAHVIAYANPTTADLSNGCSDEELGFCDNSVNLV